MEWSSVVVRTGHTEPHADDSDEYRGCVSKAHEWRASQIYAILAPSAAYLPARLCHGVQRECNDDPKAVLPRDLQRRRGSDSR